MDGSSISQSTGRLEWHETPTLMVVVQLSRKSFHFKLVERAAGLAGQRKHNLVSTINEIIASSY